MAESPLGTGRESDHPPDTPGTRALRAIETAVLRVRENQGERPTPTAHSESPGEGSIPPPRIDADGDEPAAGRTPPGFFASLGALALLIAIGAVVLILVLASGPSSKPTSTGSSAPTHHAAASHPAGGPTARHTSGAPPSRSNGAQTPSTPSATPSSVGSPPSTSPASTTTSAPVSALASGDPVITSLDPANGSPGQQLVVVGANFLSSSGEIVAAFNGKGVPTSCPTQTTCTVTVPPPIGGPAAQVTITTSIGTSNAMNFVYGGTAATAPPATAGAGATPPVVASPTCARPGVRCPVPGDAPLSR
jgi:IPT/TIG domain